MNKIYTIQTPKVVSEVLDTETIIINMETGSYYSLNQVGTTLWNAIAEGTPIDLTNAAVADFIAVLVRDELIVETKQTSSAAACIVAGIPTIETYQDMQEMLLADPIHDVENLGWPKIKESL